MAFDGITISGIVSQLKNNVIGGRIDKIYQPEGDEIILGIRSFGNSFKLLITANPSHPRIHFTQANKSNPLNPPLFCMVLRKHLQSGKIIDITQPEFERIVVIHIESLNEMGDYSVKRLILEVMGRHSNLILVDENDTILECIKHITHDKSSVREVLPGKKYAFPPGTKLDTLKLDKENFNTAVNNNQNNKIQNTIYYSYNGISPIIAGEICFRAGVEPTKIASTLSENEITAVYNSFSGLVDEIKAEHFTPCLVTDDNGKAIEFAAVELTQFFNMQLKSYDSMSLLIEYYYYSKDFHYRIKQKTQDLTKLITQNIERCIKKKEIQQKTFREIENREYLRLCGELITANIYAIKKGMTTVKLANFYSENYEELEISLNGDLTPSENAQSYFKKYNKAKRTFTALQEQAKSNDTELEYLEGVLTSVSNCITEQDIKEIRQELAAEGYIKRINSPKNMKTQKKSSPLHYISSDGFHIYVGKNNIQNDELTLKFARNNDMWLHTKNIPGSHVIVVSQGKDIPDSTLNQAVQLAAYYSKSRQSSMVPVDFTLKKNVKKPNGAKPGMVIYETNKTAYVTPDENFIKSIKEVNN